MSKFILLVLCVSGCLAQASELQHEDVLIKHTVQSGETLHSITRSYLGTDFLWQENWKLNPDIENPNLLTIGQELTVIQQRIIPVQKAKVSEVINQVEKKLLAEDWQQAATGDELQQKEGIRTLKDSSALLQFSTESSLKVLEYSQIFLQSRETTLRGTDSATIEIIKGDAELNWEPIATNSSEIQIITGTATARPSIGNGQIAELRAGIASSGSSTVSVYQGRSSVESAGSQVDVKQGMGVAVKPGLPPSKPKALLAAPVIESASHASSYAYANPMLYWQPVASAAEYLVEICRQASCEQTLMQLRAQEPEAQIQGFKQVGQFYWRVAAISEEQIVGYRSNIQAIDLTSAEEDNSGPVIALDITGTQRHNAGIITIGPQADIHIISSDHLAGVESVQYKWNEGDWLEWHDKAIPVPVENAVLTVKATDQLNQAVQKTYRFEYPL